LLSLAQLIQLPDEDVLLDWASLHHGLIGGLPAWDTPLRRNTSFWRVYRAGLDNWLAQAEHRSIVAAQWPQLVRLPHDAQALDWLSEELGDRLLLRPRHWPACAIEGPILGEGIAVGRGLLGTAPSDSLWSIFLGLRAQHQAKSVTLQLFIERSQTNASAFADTSGAPPALEFFSGDGRWRLVVERQPDGTLRAGLGLPPRFEAQALTVHFGDEALRVSIGKEAHAIPALPHDDGLSMSWLFDLPSLRAEALIRACFNSGLDVEEP